MPAYANAQAFDRIIIQENFGEFERGETLFIFGNIANIQPDSFLILQIVNPSGDFCQIQQLEPFSNGLFISNPIPLKGKLCGFSGNYDIRIFYGDYSKTSSFVISSSIYKEPSLSQYVGSAKELISSKIQSISAKTELNTLIYSERLGSLEVVSEKGLEDLETLYVDLSDDFFIEEDIFDLDTTLRIPVSAFLDSTAELLESGKLSFDIADKIDRQTFSAIFYYEIGDVKTSVEKLNDVFVSIKNVDPVKTTPQRNLSYAELEDTLQNIMTKTGSVMGKKVKEQLAFIFARGTAPIYSEELSTLLDLLTQSRYLDVISRNESPLYKLVQSEWQIKRNSLVEKATIEDLILSSDDVASLYEAALLLRDLDSVSRLISEDSEENSDLVKLVLPEWKSLSSDLELATSVENILASEEEITKMKKILEFSSRISKAVEISNASQINSGLTEGWESLLDRVQNAQSTEEILKLVSEFDNSINQLREKRSPLSVLIFDYQAMKAKAELQSDQKNLFLINNALKILDTAQKMEEGNPTVSKIDRIEVLLTWASQKAPEIRLELDSYSKDVYKERASEILQRAKSIENLVDLSLKKNRFLPGYLNFTDSMKDKIDDVRNLVIAKDLEIADSKVRELFVEWTQVSTAYAEDPRGSTTGYSLDELKRIEYQEDLEFISNFVSNFYNSDFAPYSKEYNSMMDEVYESIEYGNFIAADTKIAEIREYLKEHLPLRHQSIMYDISYQGESDLWVLSGFVEKEEFDRRKVLNATVYDMKGDVHSTLKFSDTREGRFYTQWEAPADPGLYVVLLQYENSKASQIINIEDKEQKSYRLADLNLSEMAAEFEELKTFMTKFGGANYQDKSPRFASTLDAIKKSLSERDLTKTKENLQDLQKLIERYLPIRSRVAVIDVAYENDQLHISGAVEKYLSFSEDLYVDIYNQKGEHVDDIALKDSRSGYFNEFVSMPLSPGTYVAQLNYHNLKVTDFFTTN